MLNASLLSRLRTLMDEASSNFWTDAECYAALSDGQRELATQALSIFKAKLKVNPDAELPEILRPLYTTATGTINNGLFSFSVPADFLYDISVRYKHNATTGQVHCLKRDYNRITEAIMDNTYMAANAVNEYYYVISSSVVAFETPASGTAGYTFNYLKKPTEIDGSTQPILPEFCSEAIVKYAYAEMLKKEYRLQESMQVFGEFLQMANNLVEI